MRRGAYAPKENASAVDDDARLMQRIAARDSAALGDLYDRHSRVMYALALRMLYDKALAEDAVQDVFLKVWSSPQHLTGANLRAWLLRVTRNRCIDQIRGSARVTPVDVPEAGAAGDGGVEEIALAHLDAREVNAALDAIAPEQRELIELAFYGGLTHQRIAERTGIPLGTVKTRIRAGLQRLRGMMHGMEHTA